MWGNGRQLKSLNTEQGKLEDASADYGVDKTEGWWQKVVADDLDGDGDQDLIVGNIGENYKFKANSEKPFQVFAKDFDGNGTNDIFLRDIIRTICWFRSGERNAPHNRCRSLPKSFQRICPLRNLICRTILGKDIENAMHYKAHTFSSAIGVNRMAVWSSKVYQSTRNFPQ